MDPIKLLIIAETEDHDYLASASPIFFGVNSSCNEVVETRVFLKLNGGLHDPYYPGFLFYDGQINVNVSDSVEWYTGSGNTPNNLYDLYSVILHETGHLLGFASLIDSLGPSEGQFSSWDESVYVTPLFVANSESENCIPLLTNNCVTNCYSLNPSITSNYIALNELINENCLVSGSFDFVFGENGIAPLSGGDWTSNHRNRLSHLHPTCNSDTAEYVMQPTISNIQGLNQRRSFTQPELDILCNLGYKIDSCDQCYLSYMSEFIEYNENLFDDPFFFTCPTDTLVIDFEDLICNDFSFQNDIELTNFQAVDGVAIIKDGDSVKIVSSNSGTYLIVYSIQGCGCKLRSASFKVTVGLCYDCNNIEPCDNLSCVETFEEFPPNLSSNLVQPQASDAGYWIYSGAPQNSPDICASIDSNTYLRIGGIDDLIEGFSIKLSEALRPGCILKLKLKVISSVINSQLIIHGSENAPCNIGESQIKIGCVPTDCGVNQYLPFCLNSIDIDSINSNISNCSTASNFQQIDIAWKNTALDTINYIILSPSLNTTLLALDDIVIQKICLDPSFIFEFLVHCNEVSFTSIDTNSTNTHLWHFGDDSTSTAMNPTHLFNESDTFQVTHILTDYCGNADTSMLNVIINDQVTECCPDTTLSVGTTWNLSTVLPGDGRFHTITLEQGVSLSIEDGLVLEFCEGGALVIEAGAYFSLDGTLTSYGDMSWLGVYVEGDTAQGQHKDFGSGGYHGNQQGLIHTREGSIIKNAKIGIRNYGLGGDASTGGMIRCEETSFINNTVAVEFGPYQNYNTDTLPVPSLGSFRNCTFNTDPTYHLHEPFHAFVKMRKADGMRFAGCSFTNELLPELPSEVSEFGFGIHAVSSGFRVYATGSTPTNPLCTSPCIVYDSTTFNGLGHGVYVMTQDKMQPYSVYQTQFENCFRGITSVGSTGGSMLFNTFKMGEVPDTDFSYGQIGVELHFNHEGFELQENIFERIEGGSNLNTIGILANALGGNDNVIRRNSFIGMETANQAFGVNADLTPDIQRGLIYLCNSIDTTLSQGYDFHIPNTPALDVIHPFQTPGALNGQEISAGNHFAYTALDFMNYSQDTINYFFNPIGQNEPPRDSFSIGIVDIEADENECLTGYCAYPCLSDIQDAEDDYFESHEDFEEASDDFLSGISTQNLNLIKSARSKALFFQKAMSKAAFDVVIHMMFDTIDYNSDSLITWLGYMDTYGAELLIAGQYASKEDYESAVDILETISIRRTVSTEQASDIEKLIEIYNLLDGKLIGTFNTQDRSLLRAIAYANIGFSSGVARALLSYFGEYIPLPYYVGNQIEFRSMESQKEEEIEEKTEFTQLKIYPNPAREQLTVEWNANEFSSNSIEIISMQGEIIAHRGLTYQGMEVFDTSTWPNGIYLIINRDELGRIATGKAIILKN